MKNTFDYVTPESNDPIRIERVVADKPGGGLIADPGFDAKESEALALDADGYRYDVIKGYPLVAAVAAADTTIKIAKGSGIVVGEFLGYGTKAVACTAVDDTNADYDLVTVKMGINIAAGEVLYQALAASADAAEIIKTPVYVMGTPIEGNNGDQEAQLITIGTLRKETSFIGKDVASKLGTIKLV